MKRREFLKTTVVAGGAGMLFDACTPLGSEQIIPILIPEERFIPGVEEFHSATCVECPGGCGLLARKIDGRLVKAEGNPAHPVSAGGSCARGQALPQAMYHPDRLRGPLVREGERGEGRWRDVSWDEAIGRIISELAPLREDGAVGKLAFLTGAARGHRLALMRRFMAVFGSARHWVHEPFGDEAVRRAHGLTTGVSSFFAYDLERANYLVTFGAGVLEGSRSPVRFGRGIGHLRRGRPGQRGKVVAVEPRLSLTAASADEWLPARPGSEAMVALGLAHLIIRDQLYDVAFVDERTSGFEAFRRRVMASFGPERVAEAAGVSSETLERLARELATNGPAIVLAGDAAVTGPNGLSTALAVTHLNALLGSFARAGGIFFDPAPPFAPWPDLPTDAGAAPDPEFLVAHLSGAADASANPHALLIAGTNPRHTLPRSAGVDEFLAGIPFVASFTSFLDETAHMADLILPEPTPFERFDDDVPSPGVGIPIATLSGPIFSRPLWDTVSMPDVLLRVAAGLGEDAAAAFPWTTFEDALRAAWLGLHEAGTGSITESSATRFWRAALESGGWWDAAYAPSAEFATTDRRYQFETGPLEGMRPDAMVPTAESTHVLHVYPSAALGDGRSAHLPFLQELSDPMTSVRWGSVVELSADSAAELGVARGDLVEVESAEGRVRARAHVTPGVRPEVVAVAAGQGHTQFGRYAQDRGINPFALLRVTPDPGLSEAALQTPVRVRKVEETS